ncbi:MAG: phosphate signaling complex protein PhoU [Alphaproteobacteria bacterium]
MVRADTHISTSFNQEMAMLSQQIGRMGGQAEQILADSIEALVRRDSDLARRAVEADRKVDVLDADVEAEVVRLLALRQPVANDLRAVISALKISMSLERIADHAKNGAKRALIINQAAPMEQTRSLVRLSEVAREMLRGVLDAYANGDAEAAVAVRDRDEDLDTLYDGYFRECLTYMMEDSRSITASTHLLFIAKNIERIGDQCTNIAENVYYIRTGQRLDSARPKSEARDPAKES